MAALSAGLLAGANGAALRLALKRYFATVGLSGLSHSHPTCKINRKNGEH
jgi:hypothetical protein